MTENDFRNLALSLPEAEEGEHMDHADFRVRGKIFATLWPDGTRGTLKLTVEQQVAFTGMEPTVFEPLPGGWGRRGYTGVHLRAARKASVRQALITAWRNTAPKRLARSFEDLA